MMLYKVCPFGERRADMRAAYHTAHVLTSQSHDKIADSEFRDLVVSLMSYLKCEQVSDDEEVDMQALSTLKA